MSDLRSNNHSNKEDLEFIFSKEKELLSLNIEFVKPKKSLSDYIAKAPTQRKKTKKKKLS